VVLVIDQATKYWVTSTVAPYPAPSTSIFGGWLSITYTTNTGAAFGVLADQGLLFLLVGLVLLCTLYVYLRVLPGRRRMLQLSLGLQLGGAAGNLLDRVRIGHVVDFIHIRHWPVFNVADAAIFAGVLVMVYYISFGAGEPGRPGKQAPTQAEPHPVNGN
jgi:signal peptidase II